MYLRSFKTKCIFLCHLTSAKELHRAEKGKVMGTRAYRKLLDVIDQVRTTTCPRNQHTAGGRTGLLVYVRMNIGYEWTISMGVRGKQSPFWPCLVCRPDSSHIMKKYLLHTWLLSSQIKSTWVNTTQNNEFKTDTCVKYFKAVFLNLLKYLSRCNFSYWLMITVYEAGTCSSFAVSKHLFPSSYSTTRLKP